MFTASSRRLLEGYVGGIELIGRWGLDLLNCVFCETRLDTSFEFLFLSESVLFQFLFTRD